MDDRRWEVDGEGLKIGDRNGGTACAAVSPFQIVSCAVGGRRRRRKTPVCSRPAALPTTAAAAAAAAAAGAATATTAAAAEAATQPPFGGCVRRQPRHTRSPQRGGASPRSGSPPIIIVTWPFRYCAVVVA
eukprot:gene15217-biopygen9225